MISTDKGFPWLRVIIEGGVIVASILLAFGIDAWWNDVEREREVAQELQSVGRELRRNQDLLAFQIDLLQRMVRGDDEVLALLNAGPSSENVTIPDTLGFLVITTLTFDPSLGALDALIASGRLAAVADPELRLGLSGIRALVVDATELQGLTRSLYFEQMLPLLSDETSLDHDAMVSVSDAFWAAERRLGRPLDFAGSIEFPNTPRLRGLIRERRGLDSITLAEMIQLQRELDALATAIESDE